MSSLDTQEQDIAGVLDWTQDECGVSESFWECELCIRSRTKKDQTGRQEQETVFIGYDERSKTYKLYNPIEKKVILSRDVYINEKSGWD
jgi:hypothetical protein